LSRRAAFRNLLDNLWKAEARAWTQIPFAGMIGIEWIAERGT
jgi:hypothetical protein